jgi:hypothetical protein
MAWRRLAAGALATSLIVCSGAADAASHKKASAKAAEPKAPPGACQPTPEQASIGIRALQTELMVAGLKCSAEQWNTFTAQFKTTIKKDADRLQRVFLKAYGRGGATQMNAFVTQLANDASQRSNGSSEADYCKQEDVLYQKVLALSGEQLERFSAARDLAVPTPVALCKPDPETPAGAQQASATAPAAQTNASLVVTTAATASPSVSSVH